MVYGYCRISTASQNITRQITNITRSFPDAQIIAEAYTGTKVARPAFSKLIGRVHEGDTIVFDAVDRMSRNAAEGVQVYRRLYDQGVDLVFLKNPEVNTAVYRAALAAADKHDQICTGDSAADELTNTILQAIKVYQYRLIEKQITLAFDQAQAEVEHLHQRTREGMEASGACGHDGSIARAKAGKSVTTKKEAEALPLIRKHSKSFGGTLSDPELMNLCGISRNTLYKYKQIIKGSKE